MQQARKYTGKSSLEARSQPNSQLASSGNAPWKRHALGVANSSLHLDVVGPNPLNGSKALGRRTTPVAEQSVFGHIEMQHAFAARAPRLEPARVFVT
jgi:hypothetical protein